MMKRVLLCFLSVVLFFAILPSSAALASDEPLWEMFGYGSMEEFLEDMEMTEEEYYEYESEWRAREEEWRLAEEEREREQEELRLKVFEEMGGTPGIINVMYNGRFVKFADEAPEVTDGMGCIPAIPFFDAIGAAYSFDAESRTIAVERGDLSAYLVIGQEAMHVTRDWDDKETDIGVAPYVKDGVSYIPVRTVAEALGLDVYWDNGYRTVVILDEKGIIEEINKDFTVINRLTQMPLNIYPDAGEIYMTSLELLVTTTVFNSLDGDKTAKIGADIALHSDGRNTSMACTVDLSELLSLFASEADEYYMDEEDLAIFAALDKVRAEIILNYDDDVIYVKVSGLGTLVPDLPDNTWISIDGISKYMGDPDLLDGGEGFWSEALSGFNMGEVVYSQVSWSHWYRDQIFLYENIINEAGFYTALFGDAKFVNKGGNYTLALTRGDLVRAAEKYGQPMSYSKFEAELSVDTLEDEITAIDGRAFFREESWSSENQYSLEFAINSDAVSFSFEIHQKNAMVVLIEMESRTSASDEPVPKAPPEGEKVISAEDILSAWGPFAGAAPIMQLAGAAPYVLQAVAATDMLQAVAAID